MICPPHYKIDTKKTKGITNSKFKISDANTELINNINKNYLERSVYWSIELNISYQYEPLFSKLIYYYFNHVNIMNPIMINFIFNEIIFFKLKRNEYQKTKLYHNDQMVRNHLCEFICLLTLSVKKKIIKLPKIEQSDFDFQLIKNKIWCKDLNLVNNIISVYDDKNIIIPLNEIMNILMINNHLVSSEVQCLFWLSWMFKYDKLYGKDKICRSRYVNGVSKTLHNQLIWALWEAIIYCVKKNYDQHIVNLVLKLYNIYAFDFSLGSKTKKQSIIILTILIMLNTTPGIKYCNPYNDYGLILRTIMNINEIYVKTKLIENSKINYK